MRGYKANVQFNIKNELQNMFATTFHTVAGNSNHIDVTDIRRIVAGNMVITVAGDIDTIGTATDDIGVHVMDLTGEHVMDIAPRPATGMYGARATGGNVEIRLR